MLYYSYELYMNWYNWYYGIGTVAEEPVIIEPSVEKTPHDFPSCNFSQANEAIIASINDPPSAMAPTDKVVSFSKLPPKLPKNKKKKKKIRR
jgi:hypothetical protein